ncbi:MAG: PIN domain-containing protein [Ardenticatenaceae bacterium]|nr:PIN domain-containing protein [Anaerolineales bacterium]MCB8938829.1 PIN domain-containing protein [Ardenticatenaceae bacterium]MCB8974065.1 PIN domain-containing protein [Ardenticatenaceae bacterium]
MNVDSLRGKFFLDTNILVYSFDPSAPAKQQIARELIETALSSQMGVISSQVVQEFLNVSQRKFARPMGVAEARRYLNGVLLPLCQHFPSISLYDKALMLREETGYSFYDALIVAAAIEMGCKTLLSEDLQDGRTIHSVTILNPFS